MLDDDVGVARNMLAEERRECARVAGVTAADIGAEDPRDLAAVVEIVVGASGDRRPYRAENAYTVVCLYVCPGFNTTDGKAF